MTRPVRLTADTRLILDCLLSADLTDRQWGRRICERTGLGPGATYPILERLEEAGWIVGAWERAELDDKARRRFYTISGVGRQAYATAGSRKRRWRLSLGWAKRARGTV
ncbi:PadR family transcriptional regulator [Nonomuraea endophytica]|uniref:PadR family transcriptional regulator n=1 Tax=Nonomuraea endophytica TaxID=714136 RepID=UPI0037C82906